MRLVQRSLLGRNTMLPSRRVLPVQEWLLADPFFSVSLSPSRDSERVRDILRLQLELWTAEHDRVTAQWFDKHRAEMPTELRFLCTLLRDQRLCILDGHGADFMLDNIVLAPLFIPNIQLSLWTEARTPMSAVHKLISKSLPHKCQRREFPSLVKSVLDGTHGRWALFSLVQLVACGLLGNYRSAQWSLQHTELRRSVYAALSVVEARMATADAVSSAPTWLEELIRAIPMLVIVSGREFVHAELMERSVLGRHCQAMFSMDGFLQIAGCAMDRIRQAFDVCPLPLLNCAQVLSCCGATIEAVCAASQRAAPRVCYPRFRPAFIWEAQRVNTKQALPIPSRAQGDALSAIVARLDPLAASDEEAARCIVSHMVELGCSPTARDSIEQLRREYDDQHGGKRSLKARMTRDIAVNHGMALSLLRLGAQYWRLHSDGIVVPLPRAVALAQATGLARRLHLEGLSVDNLVAEESTWLYLCPVCGAIYSCMRRASYIRQVTTSFAARRKQPRPPFSCGVVSASVELMADVPTPYCDNNGRGIGHMVCGDRPLIRINLLGNLLLFRRSLFFICADPHCGTLTTYLPGVCVYSPVGYLCIDCSTQQRTRRLGAQLSDATGFAINIALPVSSASLVIECAVCNRRRSRCLPGAMERFLWYIDVALRILPHLLVDFLLATDCPPLLHAWLYRHGVAVCERHHRPHITDAVVSMALWMEPSSKRVVKQIWKLHRSYVESYMSNITRRRKTQRVH